MSFDEGQLTLRGACVFEKGYPGLIEVIRVLNTRTRSSAEIQRVSREVLVSLFPSWLPPAFKVMFAGPFPEFSYYMNAFVTALCCDLNCVTHTQGFTSI